MTMRQSLEETPTNTTEKREPESRRKRAGRRADNQTDAQPDNSNNMDRGAPDEAGIGAHESFAAAAATVPTASVLCKRVAVTGPKELRAVVPEDAVVAAAAAAAAGISESREQSPRQRSPGAGNESRLASSTTATAATKEQPTN